MGDEFDYSYDDAVTRYEALQEEHRNLVAGLKEQILRIKTVRRIYVLTKAYEKFIAPNILLRCPESKVSLNEDMLYLAIESAMKDIDRTKDFNEYEFANRPKKCAFTIKWILKRRPISYDPKSIDKRDEELTHYIGQINEIYALICAFVVGMIDINDLKPEYKKSLMYQLVYDETNISGLIAWFDLYFDHMGEDKSG